MKKSISVISMTVLAASLTIPMGRAYADVNPPGNARQRQELREDLRRLERLRQQRDRELRQGDWREAREYNEKIRDVQREIRQDRREIYGYNDPWYRDYDDRYYRDNYGSWRRDNNGRWHRERSRD